MPCLPRLLRPPQSDSACHNCGIAPSGHLLPNITHIRCNSDNAAHTSHGSMVAAPAFAAGPSQENTVHTPDRLRRTPTQEAGGRDHRRCIFSPEFHSLLLGT